MNQILESQTTMMLILILEIMEEGEASLKLRVLEQTVRRQWQWGIELQNYIQDQEEEEEEEE